jgi:hypothetical protein
MADLNALRSLTRVYFIVFIHVKWLVFLQNVITAYCKYFNSYIKQLNVQNYVRASITGKYFTLVLICIFRSLSYIERKVYRQKLEHQGNKIIIIIIKPHLFSRYDRLKYLGKWQLLFIAIISFSLHKLNIFNLNDTDFFIFSSLFFFVEEFASLKTYAHCCKLLYV